MSLDDDMRFLQHRRTVSLEKRVSVLEEELGKIKETLNLLFGGE